MNSDFCYGKEMQRAMQRHQNGDARVIPLILTSTDWKGAPFDKLQVLPKDGKPVVDWPNHDAAFLDVVKGIRRAVESLAPASDQQDNGWATPPLTKSTLSPLTQTDIPQAGRPVSAHDSERERSAKRMQLFTALSSLPGPQFSQLVFILNPPLGNVPSDSASQANRVAALLQWADSSIGPGLVGVDGLLRESIASHRLPL